MKCSGRREHQPFFSTGDRDGADSYIDPQVIADMAKMEELRLSLDRLAESISKQTDHNDRLEISREHYRTVELPARHTEQQHRAADRAAEKAAQKSASEIAGAATKSTVRDATSKSASSSDKAMITNGNISHIAQQSAQHKAQEIQKSSSGSVTQNGVNQAPNPKNISSPLPSSAVVLASLLFGVASLFLGRWLWRRLHP